MKKYLVSLVILSLLFGFALTSFAQEYNEAPMLAELVEQGKLPPVEERLPAEPYVVGPDKLVQEKSVPFQVGKYGGTLRLVQPDPNGDPHIQIGVTEPLIWAPAGFQFEKGIEGNVLKGFEASADNKSFTFYMREGLKWSDGHPVTTEDVKFTWEDVLLNDELTPIFPLWLRSGYKADGKPAELDIIDEYTFRISFDEPYGTFPAMLAISQWRNYAELIVPAHYAKRFHAKYTPLEELEPLIKEAGFLEGEWWNLFGARVLRHAGSVPNPTFIGCPTLNPWVMTKGEKGVFIYERNPYYFKVDTAGNQLPYIDRIESLLVQDFEMLTMKALTGEIDYAGERSTMKDLPLLKKNEEKGDYNTVILPMHRTPTTFLLNLTLEDPVWREVVGDVRFRRALAMAINYEELIDTFYFGYASAPKATPGIYDPAEANELLDAAGLDKRDAEGYRLGPDGKRFTIMFEVPGHSVEHMPMTEMVAEYWKKVGVYTTVKQIDPSLWDQRHVANELIATVIWCHENIWRYAGWDDFLPSNFWGRLWAQWHATNGKVGEEPPQEVKELYSLWGQFLKVPVASAESEQIMDEIYSSLYSNVFFINAAERSYYPTIFSNKLGNVPVDKIDDDFGIIITYSMEQWFFTE